MRRLARRGLARAARLPITSWPKRTAGACSTTAATRPRCGVSNGARRRRPRRRERGRGLHVHDQFEPIDVDAHPRRCLLRARVGRFDALAETYDDEIGVDELVMGLPLLRRWLLRRARRRAGGRVRHGPHLELYPAAVTSHRRNGRVRRNGPRDGGEGSDAGRRPHQRAASRGRDRSTGAYDTVVKAGLCSVDDPVAALQAMAGAVRRRRRRSSSSSTDAALAAGSPAPEAVFARGIAVKLLPEPPGDGIEQAGLELGRCGAPSRDDGRPSRRAGAAPGARDVFDVVRGPWRR